MEKKNTDIYLNAKNKKYVLRVLTKVLKGLS